ncbi:MAG: substrate-binding domain-containing protein [Geminocystis sp.]|nr:substrate-binding domain-containing protein [Geminocystis sp.]MCS7146986.1 substrate-binding domain-containing protein [Geminocystis sp.]MCX8077298.1 substrate-binding domain-containing protein [Geminocystis sp.]MDW8115810.1 substrate-binding domain-containing protein [Geminocystis sp.]MDW8463353.1 substrate-binding domain-containing protein [Geminocystis sp.]
MSTLLYGRYLIKEILGQGGFGKTYLAEDTHLPSRRICVIKQFKPSITNEKYRKSLEKRFRKEAETLEKLCADNKQIPQLYAYFSLNNKFFLVQEYIEGKTLLQIVQQGPVTEDFVIDLLLDILPVLDYVHKRGIIHRDIKPENIIIRKRDQKPVLIDYGAVKELMSSDTSSEEGGGEEAKSSLVIGTPSYMPHEQLSGKVSYNSDLYSLGMVCVFLLTRRRPDTIERDPLSLKLLWSNYAPDVSNGLKKIINKAIECDPQKRYATAEEMLRAVESLRKKHLLPLPLDAYKPILTPLAATAAVALFAVWLLPKLTVNIFSLPVTGVKECPSQRSQETVIKNTKENLWQCFAHIPDIPEGTWFYGGSTAWKKINKTLNPRLKEVVPQFHLTEKLPLNKPPGSGTGIAMLLDDKLTLAQSSRPLKKSEIEEANERGIKLGQTPVAIDGVVFVVNYNLGVEGLTIGQIRQIYGGKITNWRQLGGPNATIKPYTPPSESGATVILKEEIMGDMPLAKTVQTFPTPAEAVKHIASEDIKQGGSIYLASAANLIPECDVKPLAIARDDSSPLIKPYQGELPTSQQCRQQGRIADYDAFRNEEYPLVRRLFVVYRDDDSLQARAGKAYVNLLLSDEGQKLIEKAGFIPIRSF